MNDKVFKDLIVQINNDFIGIPSIAEYRKIKNYQIEDETKLKIYLKQYKKLLQTDTTKLTEYRKAQYIVEKHNLETNIADYQKQIESNKAKIKMLFSDIHSWIEKIYKESLAKLQQKLGINKQNAQYILFTIYYYSLLDEFYYVVFSDFEDFFQ